MKNAEEIVRRLLAGDKMALARAISLVENHSEWVPDIFSQMYGHTGKAFRIGITGPPGAGKSTLVNALAAELHDNRGCSVGIVAVDPSSPYTGGALLGDRVRMSDLHPDVFIRSMSSRGALGGIAETTSSACDLLDASGRDFILVETVGVGQNEVEVASATDMTVVVLTPEAGDFVQTLKAGLIEVADMVLINKFDRPGADRMQADVFETLHLRPDPGGPFWSIPVLGTVAHLGTGIEDVLDRMNDFSAFLRENDLLDERRRKNLERKIRGLVEFALKTSLWSDDGQGGGTIQGWVSRVFTRESDPYSASSAILAQLRRPSP